MSKNTMTYQRQAIAGTPFIKHYSESHGWALGVAEHKLTGWYGTEEEVLGLLKGKKANGDLDWDMIMGVILIVAEKYDEFKKVKEAQDKALEESKTKVN